MSAREWRPGDVAMVRLDADTEIRCIRGKRGMGWFSASGTPYDPALDARPLAVIDPEHREMVRAIADAAYPEGRANTNRLQAALREFANPTPPKPEEPTGLGAVVETPGGRYVRSGVETCCPWRGRNGIPLEWDDLDGPIRVLSEGVQP